MAGLEGEFEISDLKKDKVVFFGSGPVAAKSLELLAKNFEIEAVVTKPKPAHHRGSFPVLDVAESLELKVHTVSNKGELSALIATKPFSSTAGVLIDFGIIVAEDTIDYFPKGIVNSHFSLLPEWRGADPITFSILSGQKQTGVSLMLLVEKMDEGPLLSFGVCDILDTTTTTTLTDELIHLSAALLRDTLPSYMNDTPMTETGNIVHPRTQEEVCRMRGVPYEPTYSRKLTKEDGRLDWHKSAEELEREIRAYIEWPKSYTTLGDIDVIITKAHVIPVNHPNDSPGSVSVVKEANELMVECGNGTICIDKLKPAGKKEMTTTEFIRGYGNRIDN